MTTPTPDFSPNVSFQTNAEGCRQIVVVINLPDAIDDMRQHELLTRDVTNRIGRHLMEDAILTTDTNGEHIKVGKLTYTTKGTSPHVYHTSFGDVKLSRHVYQNALGGLTFVPLEERSRIIANCTPAHADNLAASLAEQPAGHVVRNYLEKHRLEIHESFLQRVAAEVGKVVVTKQKHWEYALRAAPSEVHHISLGYDGAHIPILHETQWREAMVGTIALFNKAGECLETLVLGSPPEHGKDSFFAMMDREVALVKKRYPEAEWTGLSDGSKDLRPELTKHCSRLGLDFHHAAEYVAKAADAMRIDPDVRKEWLGDSLHELKHASQGAAELLREMKEMLAPEGGKQYKTNEQNALRSAVGYFEANLDRMNYSQLLALGHPIGSGVTEAGCKTLVKARFCVSGARWHIDTMAPIMALRSLRLSSDRWSQFWGRVERYGY
jgi:hypothetical protein